LSETAPARSALRRYGVPVLTVGAALAVTNVLVPLLHGVTFVPLLVAIILATWYGHAQGGILALVLSALGSAVFHLPPVSSFRISHPEDLLRLIVFLCAGGAMIWFIHVRQSLLNQVSILLREAQARERAAEQHQEALIHAGKLATIGQLAAGVTHELNNPLNNAKLYLEMIQDDLREQASQPELLQHAKEAHGQILRAAEIVSHLRFFARGGDVARQPCSLQDAITRALGFVQQPLRLASVTAMFTPCAADVIFRATPRSWNRSSSIGC
jgi:signal transduction histidine kinase